LCFNITPIAGEEKESFQIVIGTNIITINFFYWINKGIGPFIQQQDISYKILKSYGPSCSVQLRIINKKKIAIKK